MVRDEAVSGTKAELIERLLKRPKPKLLIGRRERKQ
jgi:hypothetical protein